MLKIIKIPNIIQNGSIKAQVKGKLLKLYFYNKYPEVNIQVENQDHEVIWQGFLDKEHFNIYPRKQIDILGQTKIEHFYLFPNTLDESNLFIRITGLKEGQKIEMIKVLYDDIQVIKTTD